MNQPFSPQFHVGCELTEGARYPIFHTVNEDVEQDWTQQQPLENALSTGLQSDSAPMIITF